MISYVKNLMAYLFEITLVYYLLPLLLVDTGISMITLLGIVPLIIMIISLSYGIETKKMDFIYVIATGILFIPAMLNYMNSSAFIYCIMYTVIALIGNFIGIIVVNNKKTKKK